MGTILGTPSHSAAQKACPARRHSSGGWPGGAQDAADVLRPEHQRLPVPLLAPAEGFAGKALAQPLQLPDAGGHAVLPDEEVQGVGGQGDVPFLEKGGLPGVGEDVAAEDLALFLLGVGRDVDAVEAVHDVGGELREVVGREDQQHPLHGDAEVRVVVHELVVHHAEKGVHGAAMLAGNVALVGLVHHHHKAAGAALRDALQDEALAGVGVDPGGAAEGVAVVDEGEVQVRHGAGAEALRWPGHGGLSHPRAGRRAGCRSGAGGRCGGCGRRSPGSGA